MPNSGSFPVLGAPPPPLPPEQRDPWWIAFHDLMAFRVREILLVSSPYDAFTLEVDGRLTERVFSLHSELSLTTAPRITHVPTGARAMEALAERRFDLVITMTRIADTDVAGFARAVKARFTSMPVVLLVLNEADLAMVTGGAGTAIDHVFWWTGDARIILAIVKLIEDARNAPSDTQNAGVRAIIVVEDSVRRYSSFLSILYSELMRQSNSLSAEGFNDLTRLARMRARPKVLLARNYEEAIALYKQYSEYLVAVITDVRFPRNGEDDAGAGLRLVRLIRADDPDLPVLMQSADPENAEVAAELGVNYADKNSSDLLKRIQLFVNESLGFGDFVFRLPDRTQVGRAKDMWELEQHIRTVPAESIEYHAHHNHFSLWMMARCMFDLADRVRPVKISDFGGPEAVRRYLLQILEEMRVQQQEGVIIDSTSKLAGPQTPFVRIGTGSIGGKARGLAFVSAMLTQHKLKHRYPGLRIHIPRTIVLATDEFERFLAKNYILDGGLDTLDERAILRRCLTGRLDEATLSELRTHTASLTGPLAVRSSSLLEDSQLQPFAGIYSTYMLPNNHLDAEARFDELCRAIKAVYASVYASEAREYIAGTPYSIEEERMAIVIQQTVGRAYGSRFYPHLSGVAVSYNYYPIGSQRADDGLAMIALGLGQTVVEGATVLQFSPSSPSVLPQFGSTTDYLRFSQKQFWALDLNRKRLDFSVGNEASLVRCELDDAEADGTLRLAGSVYRADDDAIREDLSLKGPRLVTFHNLLRWNALPLAEALADLLKLFREGMGCPVEVEFALEAGDWGLPESERGAEPRPATLAVLQVRPQGTQALEVSVEHDDVPAEAVLCSTDRSMGHGILDHLRDIVFVTRDDLTPLETPAVAEQVGLINARLVAEKRPYLLVGPGRWGSSDPRLGIPVKWSQIGGAKVIVETRFGDREVEPSQGAHFFHNVTSFRIGYLTLSNVDRRDTAHRRRIDTRWLKEQPAFFETRDVRHVRLDTPLRVILDGANSSATILKPGYSGLG